MLKTILRILIIISVLSAVACDAGGGDDSLVGKWVSITTYDMVPGAGPEIHTTIFRADGTYASFGSVSGSVDSGTYTYDDSNIYAVSIHIGASTFAYSMNGDTLVMNTITWRRD